MNGVCFDSEDFTTGSGPITRINLTAHIDCQSGYGTYSTQVAQELLRRGFQMSIFSPSAHEHLGQIPSAVKSCMIRTPPTGGVQLVIFPCVIQPVRLIPSGRSVAYMTMWESTRLTSTVNKFQVNAVQVMNGCKVIIVPNSWNASCFSANGVNVPIRIVPLAVDNDFFQAQPNIIDKKLVFGTAGKTAGGGIRKGFQVVVDAFRMAFPSEPDVSLRVKAFSDDPPLQTSRDMRIEVVNRFFSKEELRAWYASLNVFVSGSSSEGWGRHQHESMCMGRPVIGVPFGGVCEFFDSYNGYPVDWTLIPAEGVYESMGHYAKPCVESIAAQMRRCYRDRDELERKSKLSAQVGHSFSIQNSVNRLLNVLHEFR